MIGLDLRSFPDRNDLPPEPPDDEPDDEPSNPDDYWYELKHGD